MINNMIKVGLTSRTYDHYSSNKTFKRSTFLFMHTVGNDLMND
jgi:hypothetical protein